MVGNSQETHYWNVQNGARSTLIGGAAVSNVRDNSSIFYNPGASAFVNFSSLSLSTNTYFTNSLNIQNGAGQNLDLRSTTIDSYPSLVSGLITKVDRPGIVLSYAVMTRQYSQFDFSQSRNAFQDIHNSIPGDELYLANHGYYNRIRDDWIGLGSSKRVNERLGIGMSFFISSKSINYSLNQEASTLTEVGQSGIYNTVATSSFREDIRFNSFGGIFKFGLGYLIDDRTSLGLTITAPRININFVGKANVNRSLLVNVETFSPVSPKVVSNEKGLTTTFKSPWIIDLGLERTINKTTLAFRTAAFAEIDRYELIERTDSVFTGGVPISESFGTPVLNARFLVNAAIGIEHKLNDQFEILGGFRTDFNYLNLEEIDFQSDFVPVVNYWDLYHISGGTTWHNTRYNITVGGTASFGGSSGDFQQVNLTSPNESTLLFGPIDNNTSTSFFQFSLTLGFTYNFLVDD